MRPHHEAEFRDFAMTRWPRLVRTAYLLTGDRGHAEDLAQVTLAKVYVAWHHVRTSTDVDAYVRRILFNANMGRFRKRRVPEQLTSVPPEGAAADASDEIGQRAALRAATGPEPTRSADRHAIGVLIGLFAAPALWCLIQLSDPPGYLVVARAIHVPYLNLLPPAALAVVAGTLAAARRVSPVAPLVAGLPLLISGLLLALVPVTASRAISKFVWSQPLQFGFGQLLGLGVYLLFGGLLVVSALAPWRWRNPSSPPAPSEGTVAATELA